MPPQTIGRYVIERELGQGGMAVVYLARDPAVGRQVAVKVLPRQFTFDPAFRARFRREAEVIAALEHPAIVPVYDFGEDDGQPYLVMRYMPGGSLADRIRRGPMPLPEAVAILERLAPALDEAHRQGIVHRDLKPGNILFDQYDQPYLADFGIVKLAEGQTTSLTATGGIIGTPAYMSPEQARGNVELDGRSDVYSLGVILFEMLTGTVPYHNDTPMGLAMMHVLEPVPRIRAVKPDLPVGCEGVIGRALAKERTERYPTAGALAAAVMSVPFGKVVTSPPSTEVVWPDFTQPPHRRPTWQWIAAGALALSLCAVLTLGGGRLFTAIVSAQETPTPAATGEAKVTAEPLPTDTATPEPSLSPTLRPSDTPTPLPTSTATTTPTSINQPSAAAGVIAYEVETDDVWSILLINTDGSSRRFLPGSPVSQRVPHFLPDGERIAFRAWIDDTWQLFTMRLDGTERRQLTFPPGSNYEANWSADGQRVTFVSDRDGNRELYVMDSDGSNQARLTNNPGWDDDPSWSPDGQWIVFESSQNGRKDVYRIRPTGSELTRLTSARDWNATPAWSPNGEWIAFESESEGQTHIWTMRPDGSAERRLTDEGTVNERATWSPDSQQIAFTSDQSGVMEIWIINADGSSPRQLTHEGGAFNAAWSRYDGLVFGPFTSETEELGCSVEIGQTVYLGPNARLWSQPNVAAGSIITSLPEAQPIMIVSGPVWGPVQTDVWDWWWEVEDTDSGQRGWLWQARIAECGS
ncbi:MAG: protein kinase [Chloroflexota bacterium]